MATLDVMRAHQDGWMAAAAVLVDVNKAKEQRRAAEAQKRLWLLKKEGLEVLVNELDETIAQASQASTPLQEPMGQRRDKARLDDAGVGSNNTGTSTDQHPSSEPNNNNHGKKVSEVTIVELMAANSKSAAPWKPEMKNDRVEVTRRISDENLAQVSVAELVAANGNDRGKIEISTAEKTQHRGKSQGKQRGIKESTKYTIDRGVDAQHLTVAGVVAANAAIRQ